MRSHFLSKSLQQELGASIHDHGLSSEVGVAVDETSQLDDFLNLKHTYSTRKRKNGAQRIN
jgi:hypothetical protein